MSSLPSPWLAFEWPSLMGVHSKGEGGRNFLVESFAGVEEGCMVNEFA